MISTIWKQTKSGELNLPPVSPGERLTVRSFGLTDQGCVRPNNEDQFLIAELAKTLQVHQSSLPEPQTRHSYEKGYLFLVADGMGGHQGGEKASALAVRTVEEFVLNALKWFLRPEEGSQEVSVTEEFREALRSADRHIQRVAARQSDLRGMGTTLTMAYLLLPHLMLAHVGDGRCYLARQGKLIQLTRDHTLVQDLVRHGALTREQAAHHHLRHVVTNALGGDEPGINVETRQIEVGAGDVLLLCSDGLWEMVPDEEILHTLQEANGSQEACEQLIARAKEAGGKDNVTAVVVRILAAG